MIWSLTTHPITIPDLLVLWMNSYREASYVATCSSSQTSPGSHLQWRARQRTRRNLRFQPSEICSLINAAVLEKQRQTSAPFRRSELRRHSKTTQLRELKIVANASYFHHVTPPLPQKTLGRSRQTPQRLKSRHLRSRRKRRQSTQGHPSFHKNYFNRLPDVHESTERRPKTPHQTL